MKIINLTFIAITSLLIACGSADQKDNAEGKPITSNDTNIFKKSDEKMISEDRTTFFTNAAIGGLMEVEASSMLIQSTGANPLVISHAKMIKKDHEKANNELQVIAQKENFKLPDVLPESKKKILKQFETLNNEAKSEFYINLMDTEHIEAIRLFNLAVSMQDSLISSFATKTLPTLRHHYEMTIDIKKSLLKAKDNQGDDLSKISNKRKTNDSKNQ